jgi:hypothetical protein
MNPTLRSAAICLALAFWCGQPLLAEDASLDGYGFLAGTATHAGDRHPEYNYVFPDDVFQHNGGRMIDVTRPPFGANPAPSGPGREHDDTAALVAAFDFVGHGDQKGRRIGRSRRPRF